MGYIFTTGKIGVLKKTIETHTKKLQFKFLKPSKLKLNFHQFLASLVNITSKIIKTERNFDKKIYENVKKRFKF
jgi:hypothetical protein